MTHHASGRWKRTVSRLRGQAPNPTQADKEDALHRTGTVQDVSDRLQPTIVYEQGRGRLDRRVDPAGSRRLHPGAQARGGAPERRRRPAAHACARARTPRRCRSRAAHTQYHRVKRRDRGAQQCRLRRPRPPSLRWRIFQGETSSFPTPPQPSSSPRFRGLPTGPPGPVHAGCSPTLPSTRPPGSRCAPGCCPTSDRSAKSRSKPRSS